MHVLNLSTDARTEKAPSLYNQSSYWENLAFRWVPLKWESLQNHSRMRKSRVFLPNATISSSPFSLCVTCYKEITHCCSSQQWLHFSQCCSLDFQFLWDYSDDHWLLTEFLIFTYDYYLLILLANDYYLVNYYYYECCQLKNSQIKSVSVKFLLPSTIP